MSSDAWKIWAGSTIVTNEPLKVLEKLFEKGYDPVYLNPPRTNKWIMLYKRDFQRLLKGYEVKLYCQFEHPSRRPVYEFSRITFKLDNLLNKQGT